jgi:mannose-1-phosphate guanylyltransferase
VAAAYPGVRSTSIDYALLEPASADGHVAVVPAAVGWSDLGSWNALLETGDDPDAVRTDGAGEVIVVGGGRSLVRADGERLVVVVGLRDTIVVDTPDALLVCAADAAQDVKQVVERLIAEGRTDRL